MRRFLKPALVVVSLVLAVVLTLTHHGPGGELGAAPRSGAAKVAAGQSQQQNYDLAALKIFNKALMKIKDNYVDPKRIKPKQMIVGALNEVERTVAEVLAQEDSEGKTITVRVDSFEQTFALNDVTTFWHISPKMRKILRFIQPHLRPDTKIRDVEYAAINGMLATLDPHSLLLTPEIFNEMKLSTRGSFGGLGIVISMVKGVLTVMNPMEGTPADKAGVKACDQIMKIGEESTINMTLNQAVNRLRGDPGSAVEVTLMRKGWSTPRRKRLVRAKIEVPSVTSRMLSKKVGYIRLKSFQGNSTDEMRQHLGKLREEGMRGLVLDLRGNPGGLLDQAVRISDLFIESGTLLATVSHAGKNREEKRANLSDTEPRYPMVVLVSSGSASASEIVAGALKNLDRAVVMGSRTFGKGTVQVLYDNPEDDSALKLTIAEYLTPGDVSIQAVGITPDVRTAAAYVSSDWVHLDTKDTFRREKDLSKHLLQKQVRKARKASRTLYYLAEKDEDEEAEQRERSKEGNLCLNRDRECKPSDEDKFEMDFQIETARDLVSQARTWRRSEILAAADSFFVAKQQQQETRLVAEMKKLGVDWGEVAAGSGKPEAEISVNGNGERIEVAACRTAKLRLTVKNTGTAPFSRLKAVTKSSNPQFKGYEFVLGRIDPGQSKSWEVPLRVRDAPTRVDEVTFVFDEANGNEPPEYTVPFAVKGVERPVFAYGYQMIDDVEGNRDGQVQRGERVRLFVKVRNTGKGTAFRTITTLKNLSGEGIFLRKGRFVLGKLAPGQSRNASFTLDVQRAFSLDDFKLELMVYDDGLREYVSEKLTFPLSGSGEAPATANGTVRVREAKATFRAWADGEAPEVGHAPQGAAFKVLGRLGSWYRVLVGPNRPAFVASSAVTPGGTPSPGSFVSRWQVTPPTLTLATASHATTADKIVVTGEVHDETRVIDMYIFVRNRKAKIDGRKVFYKSNGRAKNPGKMTFSAEVPLWPGANHISVYARESEDVQTEQTVIIFRKTKAEGEQASAE